MEGAQAPPRGRAGGSTDRVINYTPPYLGISYIAVDQYYPAPAPMPHTTVVDSAAAYIQRVVRYSYKAARGLPPTIWR